MQLARAVLVLTCCALACGCNCGGQNGNDGGAGGGSAGGGSGGGGGGNVGGGTGGGGTGGGGTVGGGTGGGGTGGGGGGSVDAGTFSCAGFTTPSGWTTTGTFRAVVAATQDAGLNLPVALTFAGGPVGEGLYVVNQGNNQVVRIDPATGTGQSFSVLDGGPAPVLLTSIVFDANHQLDGMLYVGDQGSNADFDSRLYRLKDTGELTLFVSAGPGFDDIFGLAFTPLLSGWPSGLLVAGDTDRATPDQWGLVDADGGVTSFSPIVGVEGIAVDPSMTYGAAVLAACPAGGGYSGNDSINRVGADGGNLGAVASGISGVHAVVMAPPGPFGAKAYAASWSLGTIFAVELDGGTTDVASGLSLTNYDGNILAFSPDGKVMMVADRSANRVVCIDVP